VFFVIVVCVLALPFHFHHTGSRGPFFSDLITRKEFHPTLLYINLPEQEMTVQNIRFPLKIQSWTAIHFSGLSVALNSVILITCHH